MYEKKHEPLASRGAFAARIAGHALAALGIAAGSLFLGMLGYHGLEKVSWIDSFLNASMLLGGMGPIYTPQTEAGKLFAGSYALYAGLVFLVVAGIVFAPVVHRTMHRFHLDAE